MPADVIDPNKIHVIPVWKTFPRGNCGTDGSRLPESRYQ